MFGYVTNSQLLTLILQLQRQVSAIAAEGTVTLADARYGAALARRGIE